MSKRIGTQTVVLPSHPGLIGWAGVAGQKEKEGPYGTKFDQIIPDELNGEQSFESAERAMLEQAITLCAGKAGKRLDDGFRAICSTRLFRRDLRRATSAFRFTACMARVPPCPNLCPLAACWRMAALRIT